MPRIAECSTQVCRECYKPVLKKRTNQMKGTNWVYVDNNGNRWHGKCCPNCYSGLKSLQDAFKRLQKAPFVRDPSDLELGPVEPEFGDKQRRCKGCGSITVNYYRCKDCKSHSEATYYMEAMGGVAY